MSGTPKYILTERIAKGGMAEIHLGKIVGSDGFSRVCAFKRILPHFAQDKEFIQMFRQEAMVAKQLQNKNIVQVYDFVADDQSFMLVMEYVDGQDLRTVLGAVESLRRRIPTEICCYIVIEVLNGLSFAHAALDVTGRSMNIIHRDISPQNVLLSYEGDVKITDFGIAKIQNSNGNTQVGVLKGKFRYMSPEQAMGREIDARSDLFAAGVILFEMVTMTRLFKGEDMAVLEQVRRCVIPSPSSVRNTRVPPELETIMMKLLAREPGQRYQSARAAVKDLSRFLYSFRPDFFPGEVAEFMQLIFRDRLASSRERLRSTLALPVDAIGRATRGMDVTAPESAMSTVLDLSQPPSRSRPLASGSASHSAPKVMDESSLSSAYAAGTGASSAGLSAGSGQLGLGSYHQAAAGGGRSQGQAEGMAAQDWGARHPGLQTEGPGRPRGDAASARQSGAMGQGRRPFPGQIGLEVEQRAGRRTAVNNQSNTQVRFRLARDRATQGRRAAAAVIIGLVVLVAIVSVALRRNEIPYSFEFQLEMTPAIQYKVELSGKGVDEVRMVSGVFRQVLKAGDYVIRVSRPGFKDGEVSFSSSVIDRQVVREIKMIQAEPLGALRIKSALPGSQFKLVDPALAPYFPEVPVSESMSYLPVGRPLRFRLKHPRCPSQVKVITIPAGFTKEVFTDFMVQRDCR